MHSIVARDPHHGPGAGGRLRAQGADRCVEWRGRMLDSDAMEAAGEGRCSRRLLGAVPDLPPPPPSQFAPGCGKHGPQPSRKREEACALRNLQRRVGAGLLTRPEPGPRLDNRPQLLHKILSNRPVTMSSSENSGQVETDWQHSEFINECLTWHNVYRQRHGAPPLALCPQLCSYAQAWANHLAHVNTFYYRTDRDIGQNLFCRPATSLQTDVTGQEVAAYWYSAVRQYNYLKEPDVLHANVNAGHFTQLVWAASTQLGLGKARSRSGKVLVVAHYRPAGNVSGLFQENVHPPAPQEPDELASESGSGSESSFGDR